VFQPDGISFMWRPRQPQAGGSLHGSSPLSRCVTDARLTKTKQRTRRARLADLTVPDRIMFLEKLPKGIRRKIQRRALKEFEIVAA